MATTGVAVVTGAGSGLGRCIARALLSAGWRVAAQLKTALEGSPPHIALRCKTETNYHSLPLAPANFLAPAPPPH